MFGSRAPEEPTHILCGAHNCPCGCLYLWGTQGSPRSVSSQHRNASERSSGLPGGGPAHVCSSVSSSETLQGLVSTCGCSRKSRDRGGDGSTKPAPGDLTGVLRPCAAQENPRL